MQKRMGRRPKTMFNYTRHVRPASPINTKCEFPDVKHPHHRVTHVCRQNSLDEPVIDSAGDKRGMGHGVNKEEVPVVPCGGATEENAEGLDRADGRIRKGRERNRRTARSRLVSI